MNDHEEESMMYRNILVAVDDSEKSKTAFRSAVETARAFNAKLTICHIKNIIHFCSWNNTYKMEIITRWIIHNFL